jgi:hypothetical protein
MRGMCPAGEECNEGLKRRRLNPTILRGLSLRVVRLRERLENSNFLLLRIPIEIHCLQRGQRLICMDGERLPEELGLTVQGMASLSQVGLIRRQPSKAC